MTIYPWPLWMLTPLRSFRRLGRCRDEMQMLPDHFWKQVLLGYASDALFVAKSVPLLPNAINDLQGQD